MEESHLYDVAIVGGGIAGFSAALTAKTLLLDSLWLGEEGFGALRKAERVTDYPAVMGSGREFCDLLEAQRQNEGVILTPARVDGIYPSGENFLLTAGEYTYSARTVILATGVERGGLFAGEREFLGRGVSYCAVCDGALYRGKTVAAVLFSERFVSEAEYLAKFAKKLLCFCLYRGVLPKGENVEVVPMRPVRVEGEESVSRLVCAEGEVPVDGVFFLRESTPPQALFRGLQTDGVHICTNKDGSTNVAGLFAAGDVTGRPYRYVKAAGEGSVAVYAALAHLKSRA